MAREEEAGARAMGWPAVKKKAEDMQTYVGENINVGTSSNRLLPLLATAALTAAGLGGTAWLLGAFDKSAGTTASVIEKDYKIKTSIIPPQ